MDNVVLFPKLFGRLFQGIEDIKGDITGKPGLIRESGGRDVKAVQPR